MAESDLGAALRLLREVPGGARPALTPDALRVQYPLLTTGEKVGGVVVDSALLHGLVQSFRPPLIVDNRMTGERMGLLTGLGVTRIMGGREELVGVVTLDSRGVDVLNELRAKDVLIELNPSFTLKNGVPALIACDIGVARWPPVSPTKPDPMSGIGAWSPGMQLCPRCGKDVPCTCRKY